MTTPTPPPDPAHEGAGDPGDEVAGEQVGGVFTALEAYLRANSARLAAASRLPADRAAALRARIMRHIQTSAPGQPSP